MLMPPAADEVKQEPSHYWGLNKMVVTWEDTPAVLTKMNIVLPYDPAIFLFGIRPSKLKTSAYTKTYISFINLNLSTTLKDTLMQFSRFECFWKIASN